MFCFSMLQFPVLLVYNFKICFLFYFKHNNFGRKNKKKSTRTDNYIVSYLIPLQRNYFHCCILRNPVSFTSETNETLFCVRVCVCFSYTILSVFLVDVCCC